MAEIMTTSRNRRLTTRVDLTPMVDLGFLLITFFVFTTTVSEASSMELNLPDDRNPADSAQSAASKTLSLVLGGDELYWYNGKDIEQGNSIIYSSDRVREIIDGKRKAVIRDFGNAREMVILIKPTVSASYKNLVDVLDEMTIGNVSRYVLMDPSGKEIQIAEK